MFGLFKFKRKNGYSYLKPLRKAAQLLLLEEYSEFKKEVDIALNTKAPYLIGFNDKKYYVEFITDEDHEKMNERYLFMAKEKDMVITQREGTDIHECEVINDVGHDLEAYLYDYALEKKHLIEIKLETLQRGIVQLLRPYKLDFSFDYLKVIQEKYSENNNHKSLVSG